MAPSPSAGQVPCSPRSGSARTGQMADIVATIQREQDEIIRSPVGGLLLVQGGPGTGKTAVALHRAAYLLYTHRFPLERQGVLVVGPNPLFLRYIEQVLPSLGETGVVLSTVSGLVPEIRVRAIEPAAVARLKGDPRMAKLVVGAVRARERRLRRPVDVPFGATVLRLDVEDSARDRGSGPAPAGEPQHEAAVRRATGQHPVGGALRALHRGQRGATECGHARPRCCSRPGAPRRTARAATRKS